LLYEHQNNLSQLKADAQLELKVNNEGNEDAQIALRQEKRHLKVSLKEQELSHEDVIRHLKRTHDSFVTTLREQFQQQAKEIEDKYEKKLRNLRDELDIRRKTEIHEIEERKNQQINTLMRNHEKAFSDIKNYYNDITLNNLSLINTLKTEIEEVKKQKERLEKLMAEVQAENKKLVEPLKKAEETVSELQRQLFSYEKDKALLASTKVRLNDLQEAHGKLEWEHEVLTQRFESTVKERDDLYNKFLKSIHDVQQKSNLKNLLLEKKLNALGDTLEKKEAQLNEVLTASNLDPSALSVVTRKLEDVLDSKNGAIKDLQYELARVCKAHNDLLRTCEAKLAQFGIPVEEM
jgi:hypothetical protein